VCLTITTQTTPPKKLHRHKKWRRADYSEVVELLEVVDGEEEALAIAEV
jgi:hypothetical protein